MGERTGVSEGEGALHQVILAASSLLDPSALARVTVAEVRRVLRVDGASVAFWDEEERLLVPLAIDDPHVPEPHPVFRVGQGLIGEAFRRDAVVVVSDYEAELDHPPPWASVVSGLAAPLHAEGRLVGAISGQMYGPRDFGAGEVELLELIAAQVGPALGTMRTLARAQRQMAEAYALANLLRRGNEAGDEQEVFSLVSNTAIRLLGADLAGLALHTPHRGSAWCGVVGNRTEEWRHRHYGAEHPASATIFSGTTRVVHGPDGGIFDSEEFPFFAAEEICLGVSVPLNRDAGAGSRGALCLGWRLDVELTPAHLELCEALAAFSGSMVVAAATRAERDAVVANAPVLLMSLDADGIVTMCDGAAAGAIGLGAAQVGRTLRELLPDGSALLDAVKLSESGGATGKFEVSVHGHVLDTVIEVGDAGAFLIGTDVTERCAAQHELRRRAMEDDLTGLPNKAEIVRRAGEVLETEGVCVVVADVRNFDHVNEAIGYEAADDLLKLLGARLAHDLDDAIVVGRIGGDEFAVAAVGVRLRELGRRVRESLEALMADGAASALSVDVRCGLASSPAGGDATTLLRQADSALQIARRGSDAMVEWDAGVAELHRPQMAVAQRLRRALDECSITLVYQPVIDLRTGAVRRVEALARWPTEMRPPVTPDVFVPLAERLGRIGQLTAHVLDLALAEAAALGIAVSVNISPHDLLGGELPELVEKRLAMHGVSPELLMLELTEHAALEATTEIIEALAGAGVALSIDDFGRGWSSFETLKLLPARDLKLDRSYVERVADDPTDAALVRAAVEVGHALGMEVVAEGIEDGRVLDAVRGLGCDLAQGYHLARPMHAAALGDWLAQRPPRAG